MVEFGLKLEDNKVAEWSTSYIDYEKLKRCLKKATVATKYKSDLIKIIDDPALVDRITSSHYTKHVEEEETSFYQMDTTSNQSTIGLYSLFSGASPKVKSPSISRSSSIVTMRDNDSANEAEPLIGITPNRASCNSFNNNANYNTSAIKGAPPLPTLVKMTRSISSLSLQGFSKVTELLHISSKPKSKSDCARYIDCLTEIDAHKMRFIECLRQELVKVDIFYSEKLSELDQRLNLLVESVDMDDGSPVSYEEQEPFSASGKPKEAVESSKASTSTLIHRGANKQNHTKEIHLTKKACSRNFAVFSDDDDDDGNNEEVDQYLQTKNATVDGNTKKLVHHHGIREADSIMRAVIDLYRLSKLLVNYSMLNYTGFVKIMKKFNKHFPPKSDVVNSDLELNVDDFFENTVFKDAAEAEDLSNSMENHYAEWFCNRNIKEARAQMLPKKGDGLEMDWSQLRLGFRLGMCTILVMWVCWDCFWGLVYDDHSTIGGRTAFPVFRACGGLLLYHWLWGTSVFIWSRYRVNYIFLFDFDPRIVDTPLTIFNNVVDETFVYLVLMLLYYKAGAGDLPEIVRPGIYPLLLVLYTSTKLIFPLRTRRPLWKSVFEVVTSPLRSPTFYNVFMADVFTSMIKVFQDLLWTICFFLSGDFLKCDTDMSEGNGELKLWQQSFWYKGFAIPLICLFPLWFRFNQCLRRYTDTGQRWPNLANAFKYALSQTVTLFGAFHPLYRMKNDTEESINLFQTFWMGLFILSSLYSFFWDVYMDWGLGRRQHSMLNIRLMYPKHFYYYAVMTADFFLRFMWVLTLIPPQSGARFEIPAYLSALTMSLELIRRTLWGFFRLENQHRQNTEGYRRVDFVPLHFTTGRKHTKEDKEHLGWNVLAEVAAVVLSVIIVSLTSVIVAKKEE